MDGRQESTGDSRNLSGVRVLVVEDDADTQQLFCTTLATFGAEVKGAFSVAEAMETIVKFNPDVLVADIGLPDEDGYALIRRVRTLPAEQGGGIPAMAVTAFARPEDRARALWKGFQMHVPKPIDPEDLVDRVAKLIAPWSKERAA
jgi:CheY-like chemotaxis protein